MPPPTPRVARFVLLAFALLFPAPPPASAAETLDWCAPIVVRPDQRWWSYSPCEPWWKPDTIARRADFVFDGFPVPAQPVLTPDPIGCFGATTHANSRAYHDDLRVRAAAQGRTLGIIWAQRFDLVDRHLAATPGFDPSFLLPAATPWAQFEDFFSKDTTETCVCGCAWSRERGANATPAGTRLADLIDAHGGAGTYERKVQYAIRPSTGGSADGEPRRFFGSSALADLGNPAYRAWMVAHTQAGLAAGGFDAVELNHKFHQYLPGNPPMWAGGARAPDVARYVATDDTLWSAPPSSYGYAEYVAGWAAMGADLAAAGVPYVVWLPPTMWRAGSTLYDDPATPTDENALIRSVAHGARWVLLDKIGGGTDADVALAQADLAANGGAIGVPLDSGCGFGPVDAPQNPLPALAGQLVVTPDAGAALQYAGRAITVRPAGTATGPWSAELWCHCPSPPCGAADASATGLTGASWDVPPGTCDARWNASTGAHRPRVRITRASSSAGSLDTVTICQPACGNGRDDDGDGAADFPADHGCAGATARYENPQCDNGRDDDGDGRIDRADPVCTISSRDTEAQPPLCGMLGIEAAAALAVLAARRRYST